VLKVYGGSLQSLSSINIRNGMAVHGKWLLYAVSAGKYRIILGAAAEANTAITEGLPLRNLPIPIPKTVIGTFGGVHHKWGVALPIVRAKARFDNEEQTASVGPKDKTVEFDSPVHTWRVELETGSSMPRTMRFAAILCLISET